MKLKVVIKVSMNGEKDKSKAMKIAATACGVSSVTIGKDNDRIEVVGEGVDSVCLAKCLRKKFCVADIISVGEVKPPTPPPPSPTPPPPPSPCLQPCWPPCWYCSHPPPCQSFCDSSPQNCSIM